MERTAICDHLESTWGNGALLGLWGFASKLTSGLLCPRSNTVYSPAAIFEMLRIMRLGAAGKTARELEALLGAVDVGGDWLGLSPVDDWAYKGYEAALTSGVWLDRTARPSEGFMTACARRRVACERVDFADLGTGAAVSNWIDEATGGLLHPVLQFDPNALAAIVSVLHLKDAWEEQFSPCDVERAPFHAEKGEMQAEYLVDEQDLRVCDGAFGTVVSRPLSHGASIRFLLPEEDAGLEGLLREGLLDKALSARLGPAQPVELHLPKFSCETTCDGVGEALGRLGFSTALAPCIEPITGMAEAPATYVHGAKIVVDEEGIEAGAYTAMVMCTGAPAFDIEPRAPRVIALDRPFAFALVSRTGEPLFIGVVAEAGVAREA